MRKLFIAVLALSGALAVAGVAYAANVYEVDIASTSPAGKGTAKKPLPQKLSFGYEVSDDAGLRPSPIKQYRIAVEGLVNFSKAFKGCRFTDTDDASVSSRCSKARVGSGSVLNHTGAAAVPTQKLPSALKLSLYNITDAGKNGGLGIRLDGDPPASAIPVHTAIKATFANVKIDGIRTSELRFTVPNNLAHPATGLDNAVVDTASTVNRKLAKARVGGRTRTVGFYSEIGCKGKRTTRVVFVDETGAKSTDTKQSKC